MNTNALPESGSPIPAWCREYVELFSSGVAHLFLLTGDIAGRTVTGSPQRAVLYDLLALKRQIVICYDRARGITFPVDDERARSPLESDQQKAVWESHRQQALQILQRGASSPAPSSSATAMTAALTAVGMAGPATGDLLSTARRPADAFALLEQLLRAPQARGQVAVIVDYCDLLCPPMDKATMSPDDRLL
ncbi:MAG: hypothetical protein M3Y81_24860, partial [Chloroflexota bacterium]|nr:hypothetical protein [Chloroflexota bacterium]